MTKLLLSLGVAVVLLLFPHGLSVAYAQDDLTIAQADHATRSTLTNYYPWVIHPSVSTNCRRASRVMVFCDWAARTTEGVCPTTRSVAGTIRVRRRVDNRVVVARYPSACGQPVV